MTLCSVCHTRPQPARKLAFLRATYGNTTKLQASVQASLGIRQTTPTPILLSGACVGDPLVAHPATWLMGAPFPVCHPVCRLETASRPQSSHANPCPSHLVWLQTLGCSRARAVMLCVLVLWSEVGWGVESGAPVCLGCRTCPAERRGRRQAGGSWQRAWSAWLSQCWDGSVCLNKQTVFRCSNHTNHSTATKFSTGKTGGRHTPHTPTWAHPLASKQL